MPSNNAQSRRARILSKLHAARGCLKSAQLSPNLRDFYVQTARAYYLAARALMAEAPASTRRRWRNQDATNTRKRYARAGFPREGAYASLAPKA